jgi:uncharacterized protein YdaU (DUF1376 family)
VAEVTHPEFAVRYSERTKEQARALAKAGKKPAQIKAELGLACSLSTIMRWTDKRTKQNVKRHRKRTATARKAYAKAYNAKHRDRLNPKRMERQKQAFAALKREEDARLVAEYGGSLAQAHRLVKLAVIECEVAGADEEAEALRGVMSGLADRVRP